MRVGVRTAREIAPQTVCVFVGVQTTGVYCRPSCAARLPRRENVRFHATPAAAERAGFRPCKRCKPTELALGERQSALVAQACRTIEEADEVPSLDALARSYELTRPRAPRSLADLPKTTPEAESFARQLKSQGYRFVGPTSVYAFMQNVGVVNYHVHGCFRATDYRAGAR